MPKRSKRIPSYRLHKASGQAVVTLNGKDHYLGEYDTEQSKEKYDRLIAEWLIDSQVHIPSHCNEDTTLTINEIFLSYWEFAQQHYRKNGLATSERNLVRLALRPLTELYGKTPAQEFGPLALKTYRQKLIDKDLSRKVINKHVDRVKRFFKWACEGELIPSSVHHSLQTVSGLRKGRSQARETESIKPVPESDIDTALPLVNRQIAAMIKIQRVTGMRPCEVTIMRSCDLDTSGKIWSYTPSSHKTEHHDRKRVIFLGPQAQSIITPFLKAEINAFLFSPIDASDERNRLRRMNRKTPMTPSQSRRTRKKNPKRLPGKNYSTESYAHAIHKACKKAGVPAWGPNRLRHNAATFLRKEFGIEAARVVLGHSSAVVTEIYAELDQMKAAEIMEKVG